MGDTSREIGRGRGWRLPPLRRSGGGETAEVTGARGCSAAWATKVARLAVAGAGVCRRCDAVGAVKTAEVHGARAEFCCRSGAVGAMKAAEVHGARAESLP